MTPVKIKATPPSIGAGTGAQPGSRQLLGTACFQGRRHLLLVFHDDDVGTRNCFYVSDDLKNWKRLDQTLGDRRHEAPVILSWQDRYWLITDDWDGLSVYVSDDGLDYSKQGKILDKPGIRRDDGY